MKNKISLGKIFFFVVIVAAIFYGFKHFGETADVVKALIHGDWRWVSLALIIQISYFPFYAKYLKVCFDYFQLGYSQKRLMQVFLATKFTNIVFPLATVGQVALFTAEAKREGDSGTSATFAAGLAMIVDVISFWIVSLVPILILEKNHILKPYYLYAFLILSFAVVILTVFILLYFKNKKFAKVAFGFFSRNMNKFGTSLEKEEVPIMAGKLRHYLPKLLGYSIFLQIMNISTLFLLYLAFGQTLYLSNVVTSYTIGMLFTIVSITPQGAGFAEAAMVLAMVASGMPLSNAILITAAFRGLQIALPFFVGFVYFQKLKLLSDNKKVISKT
ncbi:MAG: lysylphosphatidylglycerol synthase transmembrane domain-containing protein [Candidatus Berkelbacteria bacterium]